MLSSSPAVVTVNSLSKSFGGTRALVEVSFDLQAGEVHAVCGENGAGKSTLNKILAGVQKQDSGEVVVDGNPVSFNSVREAERAGIVLIHQELVAFPHLPIPDNLFVGNEPRASLPFLLDRGEMVRRSQQVLAELGQDLPLDVPLERLSPAQQQMVAIARALVFEAQVLVMDEPTASLSNRETDALFKVIAALKDRGVGVLYVSHRLDEIFKIADRVTVLRDGELRGTVPVDELDKPKLVSLMVGREIGPRPETNRSPGEVLLSVDKLTKEGVFKDVSLAVRSSEVVVLSGLVGAGRTEVARCLAGLDRADTGTISLSGHALKLGSPQEAREAGLAYVPEDRQQEGLVLDASIRENIGLANLETTFPKGWLDASAERELAEGQTATLGVKAETVESSATSLSGGNQQKVLLAKWLATSPQVLILDEPTRGVDIGAKEEVHNLIRELADQGVAVLVISSDLPEVLELADRILVMRDGQVVEELPGKESTEDNVLAAAIPEKSDRSKKAITRASFWHQREVPIAGLLIVAILLASLVSPQFLSLSNLQDSMMKLAPIVIASCGLTFVVIAREIDISSGSLLGLCAAFIGMSTSLDHWAWHPMMGAVVALGVGALVGLLNGVLVSYGRVPSIIVTLGMLTVLRGVTEVLMGGEWITNFPDQARVWGTGSWLGLPIGVWLAAAVIALSTLILRKTPLGRRLYAIGSNPRAAILTGIPVAKSKLIAFSLAGAFIGLAALISATQVPVVESGLGVGFELLVVTCVVVGGVSIQGGRGTVLGTVLGVALMGLISTFLIFLKLGESAVYWERAIQGLFILTAVILDFRSRKGGQA